MAERIQRLEDQIAKNSGNFRSINSKYLKSLKRNRMAYMSSLTKL